MHKELEHFFTCPYCFERISMVIDLSINHQSYVEDCEVCCRPIQVSYSSNDGELDLFEASRND